MVTLRKIAEQCGLELEMVREILRESAAARVSREVRDKVFSTARKLGYNFAKLKVGKRMDLRKATVQEILSKLEANPKWGRAEIVAYLNELAGMVTRVHRRAFPEEFGGGEDWL